jgi:hypothetical protein
LNKRNRAARQQHTQRRPEVVHLENIDSKDTGGVAR